MGRNSYSIENFNVKADWAPKNMNPEARRISGL